MYSNAPVVHQNVGSNNNVHYFRSLFEMKCFRVRRATELL